MQALNGIVAKVSARPAFGFLMATGTIPAGPTGSTPAVIAFVVQRLLDPLLSLTGALLNAAINSFSFPTTY